MSALRAALFPTVAFVALVFTGCGSDDDDAPPAAPATEQTAAATSAVGVILEASNEQVIEATTPSSMTRSAGAADGPPDLVRLAKGVNYSFALGSTLLYGRLPFQSATGTITVDTTGNTITSVPAGTGALYSGDVVVTYTNVSVTTADGDVVRLDNGSLTYHLDVSLSQKIDNQNWTITTYSTISGTLAGSVTHGGTTVAFSIGGSRKVDVTITRVNNGTTNTRTTHRKVYGDESGPSVATTSTSGVDHLAKSYSKWSISSSGIAVTWNRYAEISSVLDVTSRTLTVTPVKDYVYLSTTLLGQVVKTGPMTTQEAGQTVKARLDSNFF